MSKVVTGAVALLVVAGAGVGIASWSGSKVGGELQGQTDKALSKFAAIKLVENRVDKGLFASTHTVSVDVGCPPDAAAGADAPPVKASRITWRNHIKHGPLPGGKAVGLASIDTEFVLPPEVAASVAKVLGDKSPLTVHTVLGFGGGFTSDIKSPAFKYTEEGKGAVDWQGMTGTVRGDLDKGLAAGSQYEMSAPGLTLDVVTPADTLAIRMGEMKIKGEVLPNTGNTLLMAPSRGTATLASMTFTGTRPSAEGPKPMVIGFENMDISSDASVENGLWKGVSKMTAKGRVDDFPIDKVEMQVSLNRIHAATYEEIMVKAFQSGLKCGKPDATAAASDEDMMMKGVATLLSHDPEYSLDRFAVVLGGKTAEISYALGSKGVTAAESSQPLQMLFMTKGYGKLSAKVEMGWIENVVKQMSALKKTAETSPEALTASTMAFVNVMIDQAVQQGFVVREGDIIKTDGQFEAGKVTVNGKPMNVPLPMGQ